MQNTITKENPSILFINGLFQLMKPRVMSLVIFTCVVGMLIAPNEINFINASVSLIAVAFGAGAAGTLNMWYEAEIDALMTRTCLRPIPTGKVTKNQAFVFGILTSFISIVVLYFFSNLLSAIILTITIFFYVVIYTMWLKTRTAQNIVIGGAAGAFPPIIGWTITTNYISFEPIILFLIIFFWTPSHFWALSLFKTEDYSNAKIPMLPVVSGIKTTKINIFVYSVVLLIISMLPVYLGYFGMLYFISSALLGIYYVFLCYKLLISSGDYYKISKKIFFYSILYLFLIFSIILIDNIIK